MNTEHTNQSSQTEPVPHSSIDLQSIQDRQRSFTAENIRDIAHACIRIGDNDQAAVVFAIADALRDGSLVIQPPAQQQAEPAALALPFFAYDSETGFERFATEVEARSCAQESIDACREEASEGWPEAVDNICWGMVLGTTREVALPDEYSGGNGLADDMKPVDYVLTDAQPPAVAAAAPDVVEQIAQQWDGCMYDIAAGCHIDIGQDIRQAGQCLAAAPQATAEDSSVVGGAGAAPAEWPTAQDVGRIGDMSKVASLRVGLDADSDAYVCIHGEAGSGSVEFCVPGSGGGKSPRTRAALISLMVAMEADNAETPTRDWWKAREGDEQKGGA